MQGLKVYALLRQTGHSGELSVLCEPNKKQLSNFFVILLKIIALGIISSLAHFKTTHVVKST